MIKTVEVVINPEGFFDQEATRKRDYEKSLAAIRNRIERYSSDPSLGVRDLIAAGILDEHLNFTEPYKRLNQFKQNV
ncbi:hypothetical protein CLV59_103461 [Chitinophaga dinghuensis]|uniref:Uncharacterized protein n=1 Tax=Chitinophaga dinghuensis TaxID=1539050 RepID=A0A327W498_9BACT|nr:hypothetical protein [Chitinophaga dinghuensis]RAJ83493.1 hypothetical protein CLV59_103461 [Chitinophaga dinghuensis]